MTTDKECEERARLMTEARLARARELHQLTTSGWQRRAPAVAVVAMGVLAVIFLAAFAVVAALWF
ncbi:hypothetical protein ISP17_12800 [Dyella ginsengisoli]|uniref:Uncharacterized protein n=1 Tax=Dyella ginsengisoli TaxID=363848 RepID=A0ABW8JYU0_9GAMM